MQWVPLGGQLVFKALVAMQFQALCVQGVAPNAAAGQAMLRARDMVKAGTGEPVPVSAAQHYVVALSLAEGETIRRLIHTRHPSLAMAGISLRRLDGMLLDQTEVRCSGSVFNFNSALIVIAH